MGDLSLSPALPVVSQLKSHTHKHTSRLALHLTCISWSWEQPWYHKQIRYLAQRKLEDRYSKSHNFHCRDWNNEPFFSKQEYKSNKRKRQKRKQKKRKQGFGSTCVKINSSLGKQEPSRKQLCLYSFQQELQMCNIFFLLFLFSFLQKYFLKYWASNRMIHCTEEKQDKGSMLLNVGSLGAQRETILSWEMMESLIFLQWCTETQELWHMLSKKQWDFLSELHWNINSFGEKQGL